MFATTVGFADHRNVHVAMTIRSKVLCEQLAASDGRAAELAGEVSALQQQLEEVHSQWPRKPAREGFPKPIEGWYMIGILVPRTKYTFC